MFQLVFYVFYWFATAIFVSMYNNTLPAFYDFGLWVKDLSPFTLTNFIPRDGLQKPGIEVRTQHMRSCVFTPYSVNSRVLGSFKSY